MISAVYQNTATRAPIIEKVKHQVASIRSDRNLREGSSLLDSASFTTTSYSSTVGDAEFSFDNELVNSKIYRQAMQAARRRADSAPEEPRPLNALSTEEELLIDLSDPPSSADVPQPVLNDDLSDLTIAVDPDSWCTLPMLASELEPSGQIYGTLGLTDDAGDGNPL